MISIKAEPVRWALREPFVIARGAMTHIEGIVVTLGTAQGHRGRGEAYGIIYEGETPASMLAEIEAVRPSLASGISRVDLAALLPFGGARCALDCALWDLEAKMEGRPAWNMAGLSELRTLNTAFTIGLRSATAMHAAAAQRSDFSLLKIKVDAKRHIDLIEAVHAAAPLARLIVDPNQSWTIEHIVELAPHLQQNGVALLEQPLPVDDDEALREFECPIPICADELVHDSSDLAKAAGKYTHINIKLDKSGGLTEALALARSARRQGFGLMVGCMAGSSLAMAPAHLVGQLCEFVDLDGPLLQSEDWPSALRYKGGRVDPPISALWG